MPCLDPLHSHLSLLTAALFFMVWKSRWAARRVTCSSLSSFPRNFATLLQVNKENVTQRRQPKISAKGFCGNCVPTWGPPPVSFFDLSTTKEKNLIVFKNSALLFPLISFTLLSISFSKVAESKLNPLLLTSVHCFCQICIFTNFEAGRENERKNLFCVNMSQTSLRPDVCVIYMKIWWEITE